MKNKQKYKRCMAKAEACMHKRWRTDEGFDYARSTRHMNKWLELAEKFKEANDDYVKEARFKLIIPNNTNNARTGKGWTI